MRDEPDVPAEGSVFLWPDEAPGAIDDLAFKPWIEPYLVPGTEVRPAALIIPGGGYRYRSMEKEGRRVAAALNLLGCHAFVLAYRVAPHRYPEPQLDGARAMRLIRSRAAQWRLDPTRIAGLGFSAGAHLLGLVATGAELEDPLGDLSAISSRPNFLVLSYPVVTAGEHADAPCMGNLIGANPPDDLAEKVSLEKRIGPKTPPIFAWHTMPDTVVPVENAFMLAQACRQHEVPVELHIYPHGSHGMGLADHPPKEDMHIAGWWPMCIAWLRLQGFLTR